MKVNIGSADRVGRVIAGIALLALAALGHIGWWGYLGAVPLVTGILRFCPVYQLFGLRTCPLPRR